MFSCDGPESPSLWPNWRPRIMAVRYLVGRGPESTGNAGTLGWAGRWRWWEYIKWTLLQAKTTMSWFFVQTGRKREANKLISALTKPKVEEAKRPPKAGGASGSSGPSKNPPSIFKPPQLLLNSLQFELVIIVHSIPCRYGVKKSAWHQVEIKGMTVVGSLLEVRLTLLHLWN